MAAGEFHRESGLTEFAYSPFHQEWAPDSPLALLAPLVPPTRHVYRVHAG